MKKSKILCIFICICICSFVFILGFDRISYTEHPSSLYQVYLDGKTIGVLENQNNLYDLIDNEQKNLKEKYNVDKIYPPNGLEIAKVVTYDGKVNNANELYDVIKDTQPFTVKGYEVTIQYQDESKEPAKLYILNKGDWDKAVRNVVKAFVGEDNLDNYLNNSQAEIKEEGSIIDSVDLRETITIKDAYISTQENIFTDAETLSKYLLFGTTEKQKTYIVKNGDTVSSVANDNSLNVDELLVANEELRSKNALLFAGQELNIGLISPLLSVVVVNTKVEYQNVTLPTVIKYNPNLVVGMSYTEVQAVTGKSKLTYKTESVNGEITQAVKINTEEITPAIAKVVVKGGLSTNYVGDTSYWTWPTLNGYCITTKYEYRWGSFHDAIDISCTGKGSPIFSIGDGTVIEVTNSCSNNGYYGSSCGGGYGNSVWVRYDNNIYVVYAHILKDVPVVVGQKVTKGQTIGYMGNSGSSTGTHLHFGVYSGGTKWGKNGGGKSMNPLSLFK